MRPVTVLALLVVSLSLLKLAPLEGRSVALSQSSDARLADALAALQKSIDTTIATKNRDDLKKQLQAMRIPSPQNWFVDAFFNDTGAKLASLYQQNSARISC